MRRFELTAGTSNKFWAIAVAGRAFTVQYGRIGSDGKTQTKAFKTPALASAAAQKLVGEKLGKGYAEVGAAPAGPMTEARFWDLIARFNWKKTGDDEAVLKPAVQALAQMTVADIHAFDDLLADKLYALDTREVCRGVYRGELDPDDDDAHISADDFLYSRCCIVANGKAAFTATLARPHTAMQGLEFEAILGVASAAYEAKVGKPYTYVTKRSWESFSNKAAWKKSASAKATGKAKPTKARKATPKARRATPKKPARAH